MSSEVSIVKEDLKSKEQPTYMVKHDAEWNSLINALFKSTFEHASLGKAIIDLGNNLLRTNQKLCEILGYYSSSIEEHYFNTQVGEQQNEEDKQIYSLLHVKEEQSLEKDTVLFTKPNGEIVCLTVHTSKVIDDYGKVIFYIKSVEDVTEFRRNELEIRRMIQEFDSFVYRAFHDLQGPISSIEGICNLFKVTKDLNEVHAYAQMISATSVKMKKALLSMLEAAKVNELEIVKERICFHQVVRDIIADVQNLLQTNKVCFQKHIQDDIQFVSAPEYISIIIRHLLINATIFHDGNKPSPNVKLRITQDTLGCVKIEVQDNGVGVDEKDQMEIFNMFVRKNPRSNGSGIGLYLVKRSVERLGGSIHFKSEVGIGTRVVVNLS